MRRNLSTLVLVVAVALGAVGPFSPAAAQSTPAVTVFDRPFPGQADPVTAFSCRFPITFSGFPGSTPAQARVTFVAVPPTTPLSGTPTIFEDIAVLSLDGTGSAVYDIRGPLMERFQAASLAGWNVKLSITVVDSARTLFTGEQTYLVALDCLVPLVTTTTPTTTTTLVPDACPEPCLAAPPAATLAGPTGAVDGLEGSYCWTEPASPPRSAACVDKIFVAPSQPLTVRRGDELVLRFATPAQPSELRITYQAQLVSQGSMTLPPIGQDAQTIPVPVANPTRFRADLPDGTSWVAVSTRWDQGSALHYFRIDVVAGSPPATPQPGVLALTG